MNYKQLASLGTDAFIDYLLEKIEDKREILLDPTTIEGSNIIANELVHISGIYMELTSLLATLRVEKRNMNRIGTKEQYQDYIDKETALEDVLRGLDIKYKALNRSLSVREANLKELYMMKG